MDEELYSSYRTADYLLLLQPHELLSEQITAIKKTFAEKYDCASGTGGRPSITLAKFQQFGMIEQKLVHRLELVAAANEPFTVELNDFGSFPTHSIYINVTSKVKITELVRSLRPMQQLMKIDKERKPHFITEPHITIARKLLPWQYEKGWLEMSNTHFSGRFVANQLLLLRKREGEQVFTFLKKFSLLSKKEVVEQGNLFG